MSSDLDIPDIFVVRGDLALPDIFVVRGDLALPDIFVVRGDLALPDPRTFELKISDRRDYYRKTFIDKLFDVIERIP
jgi:hypothetical protein